MRITTLIFGIFCCIKPIQVFSGELSPFKASYSLFAAGVEIAQEQRELSRNSKGGYRFVSQANTIGLINFFKPYSIKTHSDFVLKNDILLTKSYSFVKKSRQTIKEDIQLETRFDTNTITINQTSYPYKNIRSVVDGLSVFIALPFEVSQEPEQDLFEYLVVKENNLVVYKFDNQGEEMLELDEQDFDTIKLTRQSDDKTLSVWLDVNQNYLPILIDQDGKFQYRLILP